MSHPYRDLPDRAFWRPAVAEVGAFGLHELWRCKWKLPPKTRFATFGSCFAQHISAALRTRGLGWVDAEPGPRGVPEDVRRAYGYGVYSARVMNLYTPAQLLAWIALAEEPATVESVELWRDGPAWRDALRPMLEPRGFVSEAEVRLSLSTTARAVRNALMSADVLVFTLGLTEGWRNRATGQIYALCPGTQGGTFDPRVHEFHNATTGEIARDLRQALRRMRAINPRLRMILTVSPVPLVATASGQHVLVATQASKARLRAAASELSEAMSGIDYFPSYEVIAAPPSRAAFFAPDLRSVVPEGVALVMGHFFDGLGWGEMAQVEVAADPNVPATAEDLVCEEMELEAARGRD
ncbi:MAG: GSCFA domain-containing protein [Paracoccaceae bacterium]